MKIDFTKNDDHTAEIVAIVEHADYNGKWESELAKLRKSSNMRGFRKGKTPKSVLIKLHGRALLADIVSEKLNAGVSEFLQKTEENLIGGPIPSDSHVLVDFDPRSDQPYEFRFDIGWHPEPEIKGLEREFHYYDVQIEDDTVREQMDIMRRQSGKSEDVTGPVEEGDHITFNAREMEDGEVKDNGLETSFDILVSDIGDEDIKNQVLGMSIDDKLQFDIFKISDVDDERFVRKYLLKLDEEDMDLEVNPEFEGKLVSAHRHVPAELTEEFLTRNFGEDVTTEEEALEVIRKNLKEQYDAQADSLLREVVRKEIMAETRIDLPDEYMKRWLLFDANENSKASPEDLAKEYEAHLKENLQWSMIRGALVDKYEIEVTEEEIKKRVIDQVYRYLMHQVQDPEMIYNIVQNVLNDRSQVEQYHAMIQEEKVFEKLKEELTLDKETVTSEEFEKVLDEKRSEEQASGETGDTSAVAEEE